jgi:hypothetical protein
MTVKHLKLDFVSPTIQPVKPIGIIVWKWSRTGDGLRGIEQIAGIVSILCTCGCEADEADGKKGKYPHEV